jgi:hypothetical protein
MKQIHQYEITENFLNIIKIIKKYKSKKIFLKNYLNTI